MVKWRLIDTFIDNQMLNIGVLQYMYVYEKFEKGRKNIDFHLSFFWLFHAWKNSWIDIDKVNTKNKIRNNDFTMEWCSGGSGCVSTVAVADTPAAPHRQEFRHLLQDSTLQKQPFSRTRNLSKININKSFKLFISDTFNKKGQQPKEFKFKFIKISTLHFSRNDW